jgi:hypothetical protein
MFRCSGCTQELNLHRPTILDEATEFFKSLGVSNFTFDSCKLVQPDNSSPIFYKFKATLYNSSFAFSGDGGAAQNWRFAARRKALSSGSIRRVLIMWWTFLTVKVLIV